jgi:hypothetical protein
MNTRGIARLGILAVGLGIGAAAAYTPVASADSSTDWLWSMDSLLGAAAVPVVPSALDYQISIDGYDLFPTAGNTATAVSGMGDIAIAFGSGSDAVADGGFGDYATATAGGTAIAGDPVTGDTGNNFDFASASGLGSRAYAGDDPTLCTGAGITCPDTIGSSFDSASANSGDGTASAPAFALAGFNGSGDSASAVGQDASAEAGLSATATPANDDFASVLGNLNTPTNDIADAGTVTSFIGGSNDTAFVIDPLGTLGSAAVAGDGFNFDLAGALGDSWNATAITASNLVDILPSL